MQQIIHYFLHFLFPLVVAWCFYKGSWAKTYVIFLLTMAVDLDHLLANPVYSPCRCSIGFHPLHSYAAILIYCGLLVPSKLRIAAIGLLMYMATDFIDCLWRQLNCG